ncbi:MAG: hypothetical protein KAY59_05765 [Acidobacteria bacterium]|nr:hypothetical protein [Acidobacteriota bacterium]
MSDRHGDYLWDRGGTPDSELQRFESLLGKLAQPQPPPPLNFDVRIAPPPRAWMTLVSIAASLTLVSGLVMAGWWLSRQHEEGFAVTRVAGTPRVGRTPVTDGSELRVGGWLETPEDARATVDIGDIGRVDLEPNGRLGLTRVAPGDYRMHLTRGTMHALIWAPPGQFTVATPSSTAIDLGCAYSLTVGDDGDGLVRVTSGWVGFEYAGRESFIPEGALCRTRRGRGPGTPHYDDTTERFRAALDVVDFGDLPLQREALTVVLDDARQRDALSLWHLLARVEPSERDRVYTRLAALVPPPADVTRDGIREGRQDMRDAWWNQLGLDTASWWRTWKQQWRDKGDGR